MGICSLEKLHSVDSSFSSEQNGVELSDISAKNVFINHAMLGNISFYLVTT